MLIGGAMLQAELSPASDGTMIQRGSTAGAVHIHTGMAPLDGKNTGRRKDGIVNHPFC